MRRSDKPLAIVIGIKRGPEPAWWWSHLDHERLRGRVEFEPIILKDGRPRTPFSWAFLSMCLRTVMLLVRARRRGCQYIVTFECGWLSFIVAGLQTLLMFRRPKHVILQFIMREKSSRLASRLKYAFMKWCFSSVHLCVCSARAECRYYLEAFGWPAGKVGYVPLHTDPEILDRCHVEQSGFVLSAGRTFRDYPTLLAAFKELEVPLTIVASPSSIGTAEVPSHVTLTFDIPMTELIDLMARSMIVVVPLEDKKISIGQSVIVEAMSMGKALIVTAVAGTVDYIDHMRTGLLVPPQDPGAIRDAVRLLAADPELRRRLGDAAIREVRSRFLPSHYAEEVSDLLCDGAARAAESTRPLHQEC